MLDEDDEDDDVIGDALEDEDDDNVIGGDALDDAAAFCSFDASRFSRATALTFACDLAYSGLL